MNTKTPSYETMSVFCNSNRRAVQNRPHSRADKPYQFPGSSTSSINYQRNMNTNERGYDSTNEETAPQHYLLGDVEDSISSLDSSFDSRKADFPVTSSSFRRVSENGLGFKAEEVSGKGKLINTGTKFRPINPMSSSSHELFENYVNFTNTNVPGSIFRSDSSLAGKILPTYSYRKGSGNQISIDHRLIPGTSKCTLVNVPPANTFTIDVQEESFRPIYVLKTPHTTSQTNQARCHETRKSGSSNVGSSSQKFAEVYAVHSESHLSTKDVQDTPKMYKSNLRNIYASANETFSKTKVYRGSCDRDVIEDGKKNNPNESNGYKYCSYPSRLMKKELPESEEPHTVQIFPVPASNSMEACSGSKNIHSFKTEEDMQVPLNLIKSSNSRLPESLSLKQHQLAVKAEQLKIVEESVRQQEEEAQLKTWQALKEQEAALKEKEESLRYREMMAQKKFETATKILEESRKLSESKSFNNKKSIHIMASFNDRVPGNYALLDRSNTPDHNSLSFSKNYSNNIGPYSNSNLDSLPSVSNNFIAGSQIQNEKCRDPPKKPAYYPTPRGRKPKKRFDNLDMCVVKPSIDPSQIVRTYSRKNTAKRQCVQSVNNGQMSSENLLNNMTTPPSLNEQSMSIDLTKNTKEQILVNESGSITITQLPKFDQPIRSFSALPHLHSMNHINHSNERHSENSVCLKKGPSRIEADTSPYSSSSDISVSFAEKVQKLTSSENSLCQKSKSSKSVDEKPVETSFDSSQVGEAVSHKDKISFDGTRSQESYDTCNNTETYDGKFILPHVHLPVKSETVYSPFKSKYSFENKSIPPSIQNYEFSENSSEFCENNSSRPDSKINLLPIQEGNIKSEFVKRWNLRNASVSKRSSHSPAAEGHEAEYLNSSHGFESDEGSSDKACSLSISCESSPLKSMNNSEILYKNVSNSGNLGMMVTNSATGSFIFENNYIPKSELTSNLNKKEVLSLVSPTDNSEILVPERNISDLNDNLLSNKPNTAKEVIKIDGDDISASDEIEERVEEVDCQEYTLESRNLGVSECEGAGSSTAVVYVRDYADQNYFLQNSKGNSEGSGSFNNREVSSTYAVPTSKDEIEMLDGEVNVISTTAGNFVDQSPYHIDNSLPDPQVSNSVHFSNSQALCYDTNASVDCGKLISNKVSIYNECLQVNNIQNIIFDVKNISSTSFSSENISSNSEFTTIVVNSTVDSNQPQVVQLDPKNVRTISISDQAMSFASPNLSSNAQTIVQGFLSSNFSPCSFSSEGNTKVVSPMKPIQIIDESSNDLSDDVCCTKSKNIFTKQANLDSRDIQNLSPIAKCNPKSLKEITLNFMEKSGHYSFVDQQCANVPGELREEAILPLVPSDDSTEDDTNDWSNCEILGLPDGGTSGMIDNNLMGKDRSFDSSSNMSVIDAFDILDTSVEDSIDEKGQIASKVSRGGRTLKLKEWWSSITESPKKNSKLSTSDSVVSEKSPITSEQETFPIVPQIRRRRGRPRIQPQQDKKPVEKKEKKEKLVETGCFWTKVIMPPDYKEANSIECGKCVEVFRSLQDFKCHTFACHGGLARIKGDSQNFEKKEIQKILTMVLEEKKILNCKACDKAYRSVLGYRNHLEVCGKSYEELYTKCDICLVDVLFSSLERHKRGHDTEIISMQPRKKRKAAESCYDQMKLLYDCIDKGKDSKDKDFEEESMADFFKCDDSAKFIEFKRKLKMDGKASCINNDCQTLFASLKQLRSHLRKCTKANKSFISCKICNMSLDKSQLSHHMLNTHMDQEGEVSDQSSENEFELDDSPSPEGKTKLSRVNCRAFPKSLHLSQIFREKNYSVHLFPELVCNKLGWVEVLESDARVYYPKLEASPFFKYEQRSHKVPNSEWMKIKCFEGGKLELGEILFAGGVILAAAWCPVPHFNEETFQYIALSCLYDPDVFPSFNKSEEGKGLIQIWNCGNLIDNEAPSLAMGIIHDFGIVRSLEWCPSGIYENVIDGAVNRLGLLASAFSDGSIRIYLIPHPHQIVKSNEQRIFRKRPEFTFLPYHEGKIGYQCLKVSWLTSKGHSLLAGSFSNGMVSIWDITTKSPILNVKDEYGSNIVYPIQSFHAHNGICSTVSFCPSTNGRHIVTGGSDRSIKFWDLCQTEHPLSLVRKGVVTDSSWLPHWAGAFISFDDVFALGKTSTTFRENGFFGSNYRSVLGSNSTVWGISGNEWLNAVAQGDEAGEVMVSSQPRLLCELENEKNISKRRYPIFRVKLESLKDESVLSLEKEYQSKCLGPYKPLGFKKRKKRKVDDIDATPAEFNDLPLTYAEAADMFGVKFFDEEYKDWSKLNEKAMREKQYPDLLEPGPLTVYPLMGASSVAWNPNYGSHTWLFVGLNSGLGRIIHLSFLDKK